MMRRDPVGGARLFTRPGAAGSPVDARPVVFIVDDDISVRESLELLVRTSGWEPQLFGSAEEFLQKPRLSVPSCLVLDVSLPALSGLDLQERIARDRATIPIIF